MATSTHEIQAPIVDARRIRLRHLRMSDRERVRRWMTDVGVIHNTVVVPGPEYGPVEPYSASEADRYLETLVKSSDRRSYAIELDGEHIGNVGLKGWSPDSDVAECYIEIGEEALRGRHIGREALAQLLDIAFGELHLQRVRLGVFEFNAAAIRSYRALGFVDDGEYGSHWFQGRHWRVLAMMIDAQAWARVRHPV